MKFYDSVKKRWKNDRNRLHFIITELRPLKSVAREMWGTHDALRAERPGNEVVKTAAVFGFLWS